MAVDMLMKMEGFNGESKVDAHKGWIDVLAWSWGLSQSGTMHMGGGGGGGKMSAQDLSMTKYIDSSTPKLIFSCARGDHVPLCVLEVRKAGGEALPYLTYKLHNVLISSVSTGGSGGEDRLTENVTLNFEKIEVTYDKQDEKGGSAGNETAMWDVSVNKGELK